MWQEKFSRAKLSNFETIFNRQGRPFFLRSLTLYDVTPKTSGQRNWREYVNNSELDDELLCKK